MLKLIAAKFAVFIALSFTAALAQTDSENHSDEFEVTTYGSFVHFKSVLNALFFFEDIARNDSFEFRKLYATTTWIRCIVECLTSEPLGQSC